MATTQNGNRGNHAENGSLTGSLEGDYRFPASSKVYVSGTLHPDVRVPMREITQSDTPAAEGPVISPVLEAVPHSSEESSESKTETAAVPDSRDVPHDTQQPA